MRPSGQKSGIKVFAPALLFLLAAANVAVASVVVSDAPSTIWLTDLKAARNISRQTGKPILVNFSATWCGPCQAMIHETFPSAEVEPLLKKLICVRIDVDSDPNDAQQFQVNGIPRLLVLTADPSTPAKMDLTGYEDPGTFANNLRGALGMPTLPGSGEPTQVNVDSPAMTVAAALETNSYAKLKAQKKALAVQGLQELVAQLGQPADEQVVPITPNILARAGADATNALIAGMQAKFLSERVGAYEALRHLTVSSASMPPFDPWSASAKRNSQLSQVEQWVKKLK